MVAQGTDESRKYKVRRANGRWCVERAGERLGMFAAPQDAIDHACRAARQDAGQGRLAIVTTDTIPQELHCYSPPPAAAPPYPRLLISN